MKTEKTPTNVMKEFHFLFKWYQKSLFLQKLHMIFQSNLGQIFGDIFRFYPEAVTQRCPVKKVFLEISQIL